MGPLCALWVLLALLEALTPPPKHWPTTIQIMKGFEVDKVGGVPGGGSGQDAGRGRPCWHGQGLGVQFSLP